MALKEESKLMNGNCCCGTFVKLVIEWKIK